MDRDSLEARVPEFWHIGGPSLVGTAIEIIGPALELLGLGGLGKTLLTHMPSMGKGSWSAQEGETSGVTLVERIRIVDAYLVT